MPSDFNQDFAKKMEARMATSYHKYGSWVKNRKFVDAMANVQKRIDLYNQTGNTEHLVDAANFLMMEFTLPVHPNAHFRATDTDESPGIKCFDEQPKVKVKTLAERMLGKYQRLCNRLKGLVPTRGMVSKAELVKLIDIYENEANNMKERSNESH